MSLAAPVADPHADLHVESLTERWNAFQRAYPKAYLRDAAAALRCSELELLLLSDSVEVRQLKSDDWSAIIASFESLGEVKTMTRNDNAVIERTGTFANFQSFGAMAQTLGEIDTRIFLREWASAWAVTTNTAGVTRKSIQIYDSSGESIHKLFVDERQHAAFAALVTQFSVPLSASTLPSLSVPTKPTEVSDDTIDTAAFLARWDAMTDTHQFHGLLREFGVSRTQALRLAGPTRAVPVQHAALHTLLNGAAATNERIMIFVGNRGIVQIYIGEIHKVVHASGWLNILDPGFNLHVKEEGFAQSWVVTKQSSDGPIRSLEVFDASGATITQIFGKRSEGEGSTPVGFGALLDQLLVEHAL